jgi:hypothetical protein
MLFLQASVQHMLAQAPHLVQVSLHQLKHHIDILEVPRAGRQHDVLDLHNVCKYSKMQEQYEQQASSSSCCVLLLVQAVQFAGLAAP